MKLLSVTMNDGVMLRSDIEGKDNSSEDKSNYKVVQKGDMVYNSMRMWQGANGISPYNGIVSPAYTVLMPKQQINNYYFAAFFKTYKLINEFRKNSQGMTSDTWNLKYPQIKRIKICVPSIQEQDKIADMICILDKRIALQEQLVDTLKKYKRGVISKILNQNQNVNEYRFENIMELLQNNTFSRDELIPEGDGIKNIHYGDILIKYGASIDIHKDKIPVIKSDISVKKYSFKSYLKNGDVVFADTAEDYAVGKATEIVNTEGHQILSGLHTIPCRPKKHFAPMFLGYYFNSSLYRTQIYPIIQGTKVSSISKSEIVKTKIIVPPELMQKQIASILYAIDIRIDAAEKQKEAFDNLRYGLLQQLFI